MVGFKLVKSFTTIKYVPANWTTVPVVHSPDSTPVGIFPGSRKGPATWVATLQSSGFCFESTHYFIHHQVYAFNLLK